MNPEELLKNQLMPLIETWKLTPDSELEIRLHDIHADGVSLQLFNNFRTAVLEAKNDDEEGPRYTNFDNVKMLSLFTRVSDSSSLRTRFVIGKPPESHEVYTLKRLTMRAAGRDQAVTLSLKKEKPVPYDRYNHSFYAIRTHDRASVVLDKEREIMMEEVREGATKELAANALIVHRVEIEFHATLKRLPTDNLADEIMGRAADLLGRYRDDGTEFPPEFYGVVSEP